MTYKELIGDRPVMSVYESEVSSHSDWGFVPREGSLYPMNGYYAFESFLQAHLGPNVFEHAIIPFELNRLSEDIDVRTQREPNKDHVLLLNLPISSAFRGKGYHQLEHLADQCGKTIAVVHDSNLARFSTGSERNPQTTGWRFGLNYADFASYRNHNLRIMRDVADIVVFPSDYTRDLIAPLMYLRNDMVIPHPFQEKVDRYRLPAGHKKMLPKHVLVNSFFKQKQDQYGAIIDDLMRNGYTVLTPYFEFGVYQQLSMVETGRFKYLYFRDQPNLWWAMQNVDVVLDVGGHTESFGFFVHEAVHLGAEVYARPIGALREISMPNFHRIRNDQRTILN